MLHGNSKHQSNKVSTSKKQHKVSNKKHKCPHVLTLDVMAPLSSCMFLTVTDTDSKLVKVKHSPPVYVLITAINNNTFTVRFSSTRRITLVTFMGAD